MKKYLVPLGLLIGATYLFSTSPSAPHSDSHSAPPFLRCLSGDLLVDECICRKGFSGRMCEFGHEPDCVDQSATGLAQCLDWTPQYGSMRVPDVALWKSSQTWELDIWKQNTVPEKGDRVEQHIAWFDRYRVLQNHEWGHVLELGAGPYTQSLWMLDVAASTASLKSITLVDPLIDEYLRNLKGVTYYDKQRDYKGNPIYLIKSPAEDVDAFLKDEYFDTVVMINVVEHCMNGWKVFHTIWSKLKPGGVLVFNEHTHDRLGFHVEPGHPIKIRSAAVDKLMQHFDIMYRREYDRDGDYAQFDKAGVYIIARKR